MSHRQIFNEWWGSIHVWQRIQSRDVMKNLKEVLLWVRAVSAVGIMNITGKGVGLHHALIFTSIAPITRV